MSSDEYSIEIESEVQTNANLSGYNEAKYPAASLSNAVVEFLAEHGEV